MKLSQNLIVNSKFMLLNNTKLNKNFILYSYLNCFKSFTSISNNIRKGKFSLDYKNKGLTYTITNINKKCFSGCGTGCGCHSTDSTTKDTNKKVSFEDQLKSMNYDIVSCIEDGDYAEGLKLSEQYLSILKEKYGEENKLYLSALNNQGFLLKLSGRKQEAKEIYQNILKTYYKIGGVKIENIVIVKQNLATILRDLNEHADAIVIYEELLTLVKENNIKKNIEINILISASGSYRAIKQFNICNELLDKAETMIEINYGKDNFPMATLLNQKGLALKDQGKFEEAIKAYKQSLQIKESMLEKTHPEVLITRQNIAQAYIAQGKYDSAVEYLNDTEKEIQKSKEENVNIKYN